MTVQDHRETVTPMLITKLGQHQIILGKPWMKKHGVILDMRNDRLSFWPGHCQHTKPHAKPSHAEEPQEELNAEVPHAKKPEGIPQKLKPNAKENKPSVEQADKRNKPLNLAFIGGAPFMHLAKKQKADTFAISMRDIEYQLNKTTKPLTDPKTVVPEEYYDFLDVFSKDISDTLRPYGKYDHRIELLKDKDLGDLGHSALRGMSVPQLEFVKKFLEKNLKKGFIEASSAPCSSPILLAKKPGGGIRFCVNYRKLNSLTKKDAYPLLLIAETIARLKKAIVFTKFDIRQAFHKLRMAIESEDATTFASQFGAYKWKVMPFGLTGGPASWQRFINDLLWEYLNDFCTAYLDDILIYSTSMKEHRQHV